MEIQKSLNDLMQSLGLQAWVLQVFIVVLLTLVLVFVLKRVLSRLQVKLETTKNPWDDALISALRKPLSAVAWIVGIAFAIQIIEAETRAAIFGAIEPLRDVGIITGITWFLVRFIKLVEQNLVAAGEAKGKEVDRTTLDAIAKLLRLSVLITATLVALQTLGFSVSGALAFGGIGGIAVGFAAKDLLANFFGGLMIYLDRPFAVGDWIRSPDRNIEGTVEDIGWRLTRIRTFDSRPLYVPNSAFTSIAVENPSRMEHRRIYETIGIRYDDAAAMRAIVDDVTEMLNSHPEIQTDRTLMVNFTTFSASSMDFYVYCFTRTAVWGEFERIKQDVLLKILDIVEKHGAEVAFPTTTVHVPDGVTGLARDPEGVATATSA
ncbi:MAG: mechanosensitive ion channel family protein [Gammaproteobacteria bacterium]|nr:MAG: mechanosensitive ion channel family protein [Gammaproteobacteria bacterium]